MAGVEENRKHPAGILFLMGMLLLLAALTISISVGYAAVSHNQAVVELVFSEASIPETIPKGYRVQLVWMQEELKQLADYHEAVEEENKPDLKQMQAIFYALFFGETSSVVSIESYYACFQKEAMAETSLDVVYQNLEAVLGREITEAEIANAAEIYYFLQYGVSAPSYGSGFDDWLNQLPSGEFVFSGGSVCSPIIKDWRQVVSSEFGMRRDPISGKPKGHSGIDLAIPTGTKVHCVLDGSVQAVRYSTSGYGYHVIIEHGNGMVTLYAHCSKLLVRQGQEIKQGTVIALSGNTGKSTGPHLHFEVRVNGESQNPRKYLP